LNTLNAVSKLIKSHQEVIKKVFARTAFDKSRPAHRAGEARAGKARAVSIREHT
jgi:hypothetical protein